MMLYSLHLIFAFLWAMFLLTFIKSMQNQNLKESKIFAGLSILSMLIVLGIGTKMMLLDHSIIQSGKWIHVKLSFDIILMLENLFLVKLIKDNKFISTKCGNIMYIFSIISYVIMIYLTLNRPF